MTRVDFYVLPAVGLDAAGLACRICSKAYLSGRQVLVYADDPALADAVDERLWTFEDISFVPHARAADAARVEPVMIADAPHAELTPDVVINLTDTVPDWIGRFERAVEMVPPDTDRRALARERFRFYKDRGYPLETHELSSRNG